MVALTAFLQQVKGAATVDEARLPLASLFLWVQVLHAFDVPRRRDLAFSDGLERDPHGRGRIALLRHRRSCSSCVPWAALDRRVAVPVRPAAPGRHRRDRRRAQELRAASARPAAPARSIGAASLAVLAAATGVFLVTPRLPGALVQSPPFSLRAATPVDGYDGGVSNPGLPAHPAADRRTSHRPPTRGSATAWISARAGSSRTRS